MPMIHIDGIVSFATNYGVVVHEEALEVAPETLANAVHLAYSHINDPPLVDACCGAMGPLASYINLKFEEYLELLREIEIEEAGKAAKKTHTKNRRMSFNARRSQLVLAMLDAGKPYVCDFPDCGAAENLTVDHIKPLSRGGTDDLENLRFLCRRHNSAKGDRDEA